MRKDDWEMVFMAWVERCLHRRFEWGRFDCALMAAEAVEIQTGTHPRPDLIGAYSTPVGAYRVIRDNGGLSGICDALMARTGVKEAHRGDIVLGKFGRKESLMVDLGMGYLLMGAGRPIMENKAEVNAVAAWRVL